MLQVIIITTIILAYVIYAGGKIDLTFMEKQSNLENKKIK